MSKVVFPGESYIWLPDDEEMFLPAKVVSSFEQGQKGQVKLIDEKGNLLGSRKIDPSISKGALRMDEQSLRPIPDMVALKNLDEASILYNLRLRYYKKDIYTTVGRILVALNPFEQLPIYSPQIMDEYLDHGGRELDPHIFGTADMAYRQMLESGGKGQSCIISGESGAGKTETTKLFLQFIAVASERNQKTKVSEKSGEASIQHRVLEANPLMEAFGNAKTIRNNNSSRFGKYIEVQFNSKSGGVVGARIGNYLLEKVRVVSQMEGERNYHIFYQMCANATRDSKFKKKYSLSDSTQYHYLNQSSNASDIEVDGMDDFVEWKATRMAMDVVNMSEKDVDRVMTTLAGILHLGNISFVPGSAQDSSKVENKDMLDLAAEQLGTKSATLQQALTQFQLDVRGEITWGNNTVSMACDARDALAKYIYSKMFDWLIDNINASLGKTKKSGSHTIGVLDIFGFEEFKLNSFEQLCINYTNEMLQGHFNETIFTLEQEEYRREGVDVTKIEFEDNTYTLEMIEAPRNVGILSKIEEVGKQKTGTDEMLLKKILEGAPNSKGVISAPKVKGGKTAKPEFIFRHYAGKVSYNITNFLEKNRDTLQMALMGVGTTSSNKLINELFAGGTDTKKKPLGIQFREQLATLMKTLRETEPHFVRCIKPNSEKKKARFTSSMVLDQLRFAGLLEVCRIRKLGYPVRKTYGEFVKKYFPLLLPTPYSEAKQAPAMCQALEDRDILVKGEYQIGKNKIFFRTDMLDKLESYLEDSLVCYVVLLQRFGRGFLVRTRAKHWVKLRKNVEKLMEKRDARGLEKELSKVGILPYGGRYTPWVLDARNFLDSMLEELRIEELLETSMESRDLVEIKRALKEAESKGMGNSKYAKKAKDEIKIIEQEKEVRAQLREAVEKGDPKSLKAAILVAEKKGMMKSVEARDAQALLERLEEQEAAEKALQQAISSKNSGAIKKEMSRLVGLGQSDHPLVIQGQEVVKEQARATAELERRREELMDDIAIASKERDLTKLNELEVEILSLGLEENKAVKQAMDLRKELAKMGEVMSVLASELRALNHQAQSASGITDQSLQPLIHALEDAEHMGVGSKEPLYVEAKEAIIRLEKQLEVQKDLESVVQQIEGKKKKKMDAKDMLMSSLQQAQELGIDTKNARKIANWVADIEDEEQHEEEKELAKRRQLNLERLKEASQEELEQEALRRLEQLASEKHMKLVEKSKTPTYELKRYRKIRTNEDFTEPLSPEERPIAAKLKLWSRTQPIPRSLIRMQEDQNKTAIRVNRAILQYCGDMTTSFPDTLAQYILVKGLEDPLMADEIYVQLCKHLFANARPESADRAWLLMCMATKTFPPSNKFAPYLLNFLIRHQTLPNLPGNYARLSIVQLDATIDLGPSWFKPSLDEISVYSKRPPILATIHLVDGSTKQLPIAPDFRVAQVLEMIRRQLNITDDMEIPRWGIFVRDGKERGTMNPEARLKAFYSKYNPEKLKHVQLFLDHWKGKEEELFAKLVEKYGPEPVDEEATKKKGGFLSMPVTGAIKAVKMLGLTAGKRTPPAPLSAWSLPWWSFPSDVYMRMKAQGKEPQFIFKRRLFLPNETEPDKDLYLQLLADVKAGELTFEKDITVVELAVLGLTMDRDDRRPPKPEDLIEAGLTNYMSHQWKHKKKPEEWITLAKTLEKPPKSERKLYTKYIKLCQTSPVYGMCYFYARRNDDDQDFVVGVDFNGIHFLNPQKTKIETSIRISQIKKFGATVEYFWMNVVGNINGVTKKKGMFGSSGNNILLFTLQSWELYELVFDYTHCET